MIGKRKQQNTIKTKSGLASFYIVTFVTLVLSIIVLSFVHIVINSANRTSNDDLYQSAYDSALAGVEDARVALLKYMECLGKDTPECRTLRAYMENGGNCDAVAHALGRIKENESKEVPIVEKTSTGSGTGSSDSLNMDQAYTCVMVDLTVPDYRSALSSSNRVSFVPIRVQGDVNSVKKIRIDWFSDAVKEQGHNYTYPADYGTDSNGGDHTYFYPASERYTYLPIAVDLYQTDNVYTIGELSTNSNVGTDHSSFILQPSDKGDHSVSAGDVLNQNDKYNNFPEKTLCDGKGEFNCYTTIELPNTYRGTGRNSDTFFVRLESPYGQSAVDFAITLLDANGNIIEFSGVQAHVDSTGRANDLVRRVETRIDFLTDFPYPEFAIQLNPDGSDATLSKNFSVANNCWYSNDKGAADCSQENGRGADGFDAF